MKNSTHYFLSVGMFNLYTLIFITDPLLVWFSFMFSFPLSGISLVPNFLDSYTAANLKYEGVQLKNRSSIQYRHPLTHSPWTLGYFIPFFYIVEITSNPILLAAFFAIITGWFSHLFLDSLNPEGIPLGIKPVYSPHPVKHYSWRQPTNTRTLRLARIPFNSLKANKVFSRIGLFLLAMNIADLVLNHYQVISEVFFFG
ncbi:MAG: hypothetical protein ACXADY_03420 [Candidatus Hodarchaeales archaeon]